MKAKHNTKMVLSCSVAFSLAMMAGCQAPVPTKSEAETTVGGKSTVANGNTNVTPAKPASNTLKPAPKSGDPNENVDNANDGALDKSKGMEYTPDGGLQYVSDDGLLTAIFPPGSLSQQTTVKMVRVDTGKMKNNDVFLNGIRYQMDLGDAYIVPGAIVKVTSKADDRLVGELKSMYSDYTPERYSLSKDAKGNWNVTMSMRGATENGAKAAPSGSGPNRGIMEEGGFPITPAKLGSTFKQDSRIEAFCNYYPPPKPATYGDFEAHCTWASDSESTLKGMNAYESGNASGGDNRVQVAFSTSYSAAPLPKKYEIIDTIPAVKARPQVDVDQYGNVVSPATIDADYKAAVAKAQDTWARNGSFIDFASAPVFWKDAALFTAPGKPKSGDAEFGKPEKRNALLGQVAGRPAEEVVDVTEVELGDTNGRYVLGGHPYNGNCNCGAYVIVQDTSVIEGSGKKLTDPNGIARIRALQSYDSTNCSAGICAGGPVQFEIFAQASIRYPNKSTNSDGFVDGYGEPRSQDSAAGTPLELEVPKYSPYIKMTLTDSGGTAYQQDFVMEYELDGQPQKVGDDKRWDLEKRSAENADLKFFLPGVTKDDPVKLSIKKIYSRDLTMVADAKDLLKYQDYEVQRNNIFNIKIDMIPNEAK